MGEVSGNLSRQPAKSNKKYDVKELKVPVNSVQFQTYVQRLCIRVDASKDIYKYDTDNLYPQKVKTIADRSPSTKNAIETAADFVNGDGFVNEDLNTIVINNEGETMADLLRFASLEKKTFKGVAIQVNYNRFGEATEFNGIPFEFVRKKSDDTGYYVNTNWEHRNSLFGDDYNEKEFYFNFNPANALNEIEEVGYDNYKGQLAYFKEEKKAIYPLCKFDPVLDYSQYEAEAALYQLSNIQNDFSLSGAFKIPSNAKFSNQNEDIERKLRGNTKGAENAGRFVTVQIPPQTGGETKDFKIFEPFSRNNIDNLLLNQNKNAETKIFAIYKQPRILNSITDQGMFNDQQLQDAYNYYNTVTEADRQELRRLFNTITEFSIWSGNDFEIKKQLWISTEENNTNNGTTD